MSELLQAEYLRSYENRAYDTLTTVGEYTEILPKGSELQHELDPAQLSSILSVQSLAMGSLRHIARTKLQGDKYNRRHGFAILSESSTSRQAYDGAAEEYLSYRIAKNNFVDWSMRVRFRQNERTIEKATTSLLDDYYFAWRRGRVVVAASLNKHTVATDGFTTEDEHVILRPVSDTEVLELHDRMYDHVESSGAWAEDSFLRPSDFARATA